jgi:hypothetical protein
LGLIQNSVTNGKPTSSWSMTLPGPATMHCGDLPGHDVGNDCTMGFNVAICQILDVAETFKPPLAPRFCPHLRSLQEVTLAYNAKQPITGCDNGNAADMVLRH